MFQSKWKLHVPSQKVKIQCYALAGISLESKNNLGDKNSCIRNTLFSQEIDCSFFCLFGEELHSRREALFACR